MSKYSIKHPDPRNYTVIENGTVQDEKSPNFGQPTESVIAYCGTPRDAIKSLYRVILGDEVGDDDLLGIKDLDERLARSEAACERIARECLKEMAASSSAEKELEVAA